MSALTFDFGNRCGHDPAKPNLELPNGVNDKRPQVIKKIIKKIKNFYHNPNLLSFLNHLDRQRRSESRESMIQVLTVLLENLDLVTMKVVRKNELGQFENVKIAYLHAQSGLSFSRFKRAWLALIASGVCKSFEQYEQAGDTYKGLPSIKTITPVLFTALHLNKSLENSREYHSQNRIKRKNRRLPAQKAAEKLIDYAQSIKARKNFKKAVKCANNALKQTSEANHISNLLKKASWNK